MDHLADSAFKFTALRKEKKLIGRRESSVPTNAAKGLNYLHHIIVEVDKGDSGTAIEIVERNPLPSGRCHDYKKMDPVGLEGLFHSVPFPLFHVSRDERTT